MIKTKKRGSLIIISGTTCAGKGTVIKELLKVLSVHGICIILISLSINNCTIGLIDDFQLYLTIP